MGHTWKSGLHLEKCVTLGKVGHFWKNGSPLENWVTKPQPTNDYLICSEEGIKLYTSASKFLSFTVVKSQFTLSTQLIKPNYLGKINHTS